MSKPPVVRRFIRSLAQRGPKGRTERRERCVEAGVEFAPQPTLEEVVGLMLLIQLQPTDHAGGLRHGVENQQDFLLWMFDLPEADAIVHRLGPARCDTRGRERWCRQGRAIERSDDRQNGLDGLHESPSRTCWPYSPGERKGDAP